MPGITPTIIGGTFSSGTSRTGPATLTGDSFTDTFSIPHNLGTIPRYANAVAQNFRAIGSFSVTWDATNIWIMYDTAPEAGELKYTWIAVL